MHLQAVDDSLIVVVLAGHGTQRDVLDTSDLKVPMGQAVACIKL